VGHITMLVADTRSLCIPSPKDGWAHSGNDALGSADGASDGSAQDGAGPLVGAGEALGSTGLAL
jgi:hypothetical protein